MKDKNLSAIPQTVPQSSEALPELPELFLSQFPSEHMQQQNDQTLEKSYDTEDDKDFSDFVESSLQRRDSFILSKLPPISDWREGLKIFCESDEPPVVLVDMDNTLVNWESQFERLMAQHHPQIPIVPPPQRTEFKIELNYEDEYRGPILHLTSLDEFWLSMDPVPGAIEAINEMVSLGVVVFIVTTPDAKHTSRSAYEKIAWVEKHLGPEWKYRSVLTHDKTLVKGDVLIDDKPAASVGLLQPSWTHALFAQPYNLQRSSCPRLDRWSDWGQTVYRILIDRETQKRDVPALDINIQKKLSTASNEVRHQHPRRLYRSEGVDGQDGLGNTSNSNPTNPVSSATSSMSLHSPDACCGTSSRFRSPIRNSLNLSRISHTTTAEQKSSS